VGQFERGMRILRMNRGPEVHTTLEIDLLPKVRIFVLCGFATQRTNLKDKD
jgi:hypothetical protein